MTLLLVTYVLSLHLNSLLVLQRLSLGLLADCDTCRWIAPEFYGRVGSQSAMTAQPQSQEDRILSFQALLSCPTYALNRPDHNSTLTCSHSSYAINLRHLMSMMFVMVTPPCKLSFLVCRHSIHSQGDKGNLKEAVQRYPEPVKGAEGVYYCGYNSEKSYGGSAWLIVRKEGNVMIDSPRFDPKLVKRIKVTFLGAQLPVATNIFQQYLSSLCYF